MIFFSHDSGPDIDNAGPSVQVIPDDKNMQKHKRSSQSTGTLSMAGNQKIVKDKACVKTLRKHRPFSERSENSGARQHQTVMCGFADRLVQNPWFDRVFAVVILSNTLFVGLQMELSSKDPRRKRDVFLAVNYLYTILFTLEIMLRILSKGFSSFLLHRHWYWDFFDLCVVLVSILEVLIDTWWKNAGMPENLTFMRVIRIARVLSRFTRLMTVLRLTRYLRPLRVLLKSALFSLRSVTWVAFFMLSFIYMFAVLFTSAAQEHISASRHSSAGIIELDKSFGSLLRSMHTLYQAVTGGHDWGTTAAILSHIHDFWLLLFLVYQFVMTFALMNVITGVFCNGAIEGAQQDQNEVVEAHMAQMQKYVSKFKCLFRAIDSDHNGNITVDELEQHLEDEAVQAYLAAIDIEPKESWTLFALLDEDESEEIDLEEFILGCLRLKGAAKAVDVAKLSIENKILNSKLKHLMEDVSSCNADAQSIIRMLKPRTYLMRPTCKRPLSEPVGNASFVSKLLNL